MDTSFLASGPITWSALVAFALAIVALGKAFDWAAGKFRAGAKEAVSPLQVDITATKLDLRALDEKLNVFKIEVARTYVTSNVIERLERRIDDMAASVRDEMRETRETMLQAIVGDRPHR